MMVRAMIDQGVLNQPVLEKEGLEEGSESGGAAPEAKSPNKVPAAQSTPSSREAQRKRAHELAIEVARLLDENKCTDVLVLDVHALTQVQDYIVIASGTSERQMRTCTGDIKALVDLHEQSVYRADKDTTGTWQVIDCVDVVVHLFEPNTRGYYDLESRWGDAPRVAWQREGQAKSKSSELAESNDGIEASETFGDEGDSALVKKPAKKSASKKTTKKPASKPATKVAAKATTKVAKKSSTKAGTKAKSAVAAKPAGKVASKTAKKAAKKVSTKLAAKPAKKSPAKAKAQLKALPKAKAKPKAAPAAKKKSAGTPTKSKR